MNNTDYFISEFGVLIERTSYEISDDILCTIEIRYEGELFGEITKTLEWFEV